MHFSGLFIARPIATALLTLALTLAGALAYFLLPVAPLPQVEFPVISVNAALPGASPETMAATVATPLERTLGQIAGVNEISSSSTQGSTRIILQFDLDRSIDGAARDVQAAINAALPLLPSGLPANPNYRKVSPAAAPVLILALSSPIIGRGEIYDIASTLLAQRLAQVDGIGQVDVSGGALPAVRVAVDPGRLSALGLSLDDVRSTLVLANARQPKGMIDGDHQHWTIGANDQAMKAADYEPLIVRYRNHASVRLGDIAQVSDSVQDTRNYGASNGKPAVLLVLRTQPGANIIATVDRVRDLLPRLRAMLPAAVELDIVMDRTPTIRASLQAMGQTIIHSTLLVALVVFLFLRRARATMIPMVAAPASLIGTLGVMYLFGYSLDNLSLMALTIATGFVVDDAIVVLENIMRHREKGKSPWQAAWDGSREIGFTVVSISISLIAVFIPILAMGGIVGRMFREFAVTLSAAIVISMLISLTLTPAMAAHGLSSPIPAAGPVAQRFNRILRALRRRYRQGLAWCLRHAKIVLAFLAATIVVNITLYGAIKKGFFPQQDTGRLVGTVQADQSISFEAMREKMNSLMSRVSKDPAVESVTGFTGGGQRNFGMIFVSLKPLRERRIGIDAVIGRLRKQLAGEAGARLFLVPMQDVRIGGRPGNAQYQFTLQADELDALRTWEPKIRSALATLPQLTDVNTDQEERGLQTALLIDRDAATRLGLDMRSIDATLSNAFSQRQVSTIYDALNQYRVILGVEDRFLRDPQSLEQIRLTRKSGEQIPLSAVAQISTNNTPLSVNHQGAGPASTISFNLKEGVSLGEASAAISQRMNEIGTPSTVHASFQGTARAFQESMTSQPLLILTALLALYIVLGILYEDLLHPLTILSTLPSAGIGALLGLMLFDTEFSIIAFIGVILLIGIVKKNAIIMIDFALVRQRQSSLSAAAAIYRAAILRFRPIMMTTCAAIGGAIPLALGQGDGAELRTPLGISIVGGLIVSQVLTLFTTPVVYVALDRLRTGWRRARPALPKGGAPLSPEVSS